MRKLIPEKYQRNCIEIGVIIRVKGVEDYSASSKKPKVRPISYFARLLEFTSSVTTKQRTKVSFIKDRFVLD